MDTNAILNAITTVGFPIVCCIVLAYYFYKDNKYRQEQNGKREERLFNTIDKFSVSLDNLNDTIEKFNTRLELIEKNVGLDK